MTIERHQAVPGMFRFQIDRKDVFSSVTASRRPKMIFVAGQLATSEKGEVRQVCENIKAALAAAGATMDDVVQTSTFVTDWGKFAQALDVRQEYLGQSLPTSTTVQVVALAHPDYMVEISAIAMLEA